MSTIDSIPSDLELNELWEQKGGSNWLAAGALDVRKLATLMKGRKARFITITATELPEHGGIVMDYHWDLDGQLLSFEVQVENGQVDSIYDLCEAADWIEREYPRILCHQLHWTGLRVPHAASGDKVGVNLREEAE